MSSKYGVVVVHGNFSIPIDNILCATLIDNNIQLFLKDPVVLDGVESTFILNNKNDSLANQNYKSIIDAISDNNVAYIPLNGEPMPTYDQSRRDNSGGKGLLVLDYKYAIPASNIAIIMFDKYIDKNMFDLMIYLRHPLKIADKTPVTRFALAFKDQIERQNFHDALLMAIYFGYKIDYIP